MTRIAIVGGPNTGKTTLAGTLGPYLSTDDVKDMGWSESSAEVATWLQSDDDVLYGPDLIVEGVAVPRALRKYLDAVPDTAPVDLVIVLTYHYLSPLPSRLR